MTPAPDGQADEPIQPEDVRPEDVAPMTDDPVDPVTGDAAGHVDEAGVAETPAAPGPDLSPEDIEGRPQEQGDPDPAQDELTLARMELAERTADLQRLQAEFVNYKRRVERDRELLRENATYAALTPIIEVLDTIDRARESAQKSGQDLDDGFRAVADQLERTVEKLGLAKFGTPGDAFDPSLHEALSHLGEDPEVEVTTCKVVAKAGYRIGDRVVRAAQVLVADPPQ
ncbi:nucleotide exchange factor GrpE [Nocardioides abyssi]|uniref:Protein GrpE n=1 Tax=Nocardioides abyssi TaxID=3058370 RepID=A0ABT8ERS6_9ACTN|nr:nucleotide exchange factor GrpE [Nocardioides abyssi]MDN4160794.1 nucleotide exchange factor GrpE [Nocardioides abyssi]